MSDVLKYKVGDKVKVRQWNDMVKEFGLNWAGEIQKDKNGESFVDDMKEFCGKEIKIEKVVDEGYISIGWGWQDWMFEDKPAYTQDVLDIIEQLNNIYMPEIFRSKFKEPIQEKVSTPEPVEPSLEVMLANAKLLLKRLGYTVVSDENLLRILTQPIKVKNPTGLTIQDDFLNTNISWTIVLPSAAEVFASIRPRVKETEDEE